MHYRLAAPDDIADAGRIAAHSFPAPERTPAWWENRLSAPMYGGGVDTLLVGSDDRGVAAACQIHPLRQWIAGEAMPMTGIGTVAISPAHRKRGHAADLVTAALRAGRDRGDIVSALFPFRIAFYHKLGYGLAGEAQQYHVPATTLPDSSERARVALLDDDDGKLEALALYNCWASSQSGQLDRSPELWRQVTGEGRVLFGYRGYRGEMEGYTIVTYRIDLPPQQRHLEVDELVWTTDAARRGLYAWLGSLGDQWQHILIRALPSDRLGDWLREPRLPAGAAPPWRLAMPAATLMNGPMFRVLDVRAAFEGRRVEPVPPIAVAMEVDDPQIEENRGSWRIAMDTGRAIVERTGALDVSLRMDIATLSRIFIGALSPSAAMRAGLLECDHPALLGVLDAALAMPDPWTFDRF